MTAPTTAQVRVWLAELPDLCALLPDALATRTAGQQTSRPVPHSKPPVRLDIVALLDTRERCDWEQGMWRVDPDGQGVLPWLWGWARDLESCAYDLRPTLCDEVPEKVTVASLCQWLLQDDLLEWCEVTLQQWDEFAYDLRRVVASVREATRNVRDAEVKPVGCPRCGYPLEQVKPGMWECSEGHPLTVRPVTLREAARATGVRRDTLRDWLDEAGVQRLRENATRHLYDLGEVRRVVAHKRLSGLAG